MDFKKPSWSHSLDNGHTDSTETTKNVVEVTRVLLQSCMYNTFLVFRLAIDTSTRAFFHHFMCMFVCFTAKIKDESSTFLIILMTATPCGWQHIDMLLMLNVFQQLLTQL